MQDAAAKAKLKLGLFSYPVLQAADILLYRYVLFLVLLRSFSKSLVVAKLIHLERRMSQLERINYNI